MFLVSEFLCEYPIELVAVELNLSGLPSQIWYSASMFQAL